LNAEIGRLNIVNPIRGYFTRSFSSQYGMDLIQYSKVQYYKKYAGVYVEEKHIYVEKKTLLNS